MVSTTYQLTIIIHIQQHLPLPLCATSTIVLMFGFVNDTYEVVEDTGPAIPRVSLIDGDLGDFAVTLIAAIDEDFAPTTAIGIMHK